VPLRGLLILSMDGALAAPVLTPAGPREVLSALVTHTYRPSFVPAGRRGAHLRTCATLAARLPGWHLTRPWGLARAPEDAGGLVEALGALLAELPPAAQSATA
jgi:hypothetical protein